MLLWSSILLIALLSISVGANDPVVVKNESITITINHGNMRITGQKLTFDSGLKAVQFFGIPYAQPPVGPLRLEKPRPLVGTHTVDATSQEVTVCLQAPIASIVPPLSNLNEDCLHLSLFAPAPPTNSHKKQLLPVFVYIHGGGFLFESTVLSVGSRLGPVAGFVPNFVSRDIIVVAIQYRVSIMGFFSDGSEELPGNLGLFDQTLALKWIQDNIADFGGDKNRVTIWGESAGSGSVSSLSVSRHSRDLFNQTIQISGSTFASWVYNQNVVANSIKAAEMLGCPKESGASLKACLRNVTDSTLISVMGNLLFTGSDYEFAAFNPRFDGFQGGFFEAPLKKLIAESEPKHSIVSFAKDDGLLFGYGTPQQLIRYGKSDLLAYIVNYIVSPAPDFDIISFRTRLVDFYVYGEWDNTVVPHERDDTFYFQRYINLLTDIEFAIPAVWEAQQKAKNSWTVYAYQLDYVPPVTLSTMPGLPYYGVPHTAELPYIINPRLLSSDLSQWTKDDETMRELFVGTFSNFIKTGDPTSTSIPTWPRVTPSDPYNFISMKLKPSPNKLDSPTNARIEFWARLANDFDLTKVHGLPYIERL